MTDDVAGAADSTLGPASALFAGRYRVERELGAGGMATVYLAYDVKHERKVALKVLKPELAAVIGAERFLAEIKTTAHLQHAHILSLFDSGEARANGVLGAAGSSVVFYVMPFVEGESLRDRLERERQLPVSDAIRLTREVADALSYAHARGVIHRDIKPENILLQGGHAVVADFGIALAASRTGASRLTETGMSLGTPAYMSPEQAMGERTIDARTDIYALGCVLYEMLVGEPPFTGPTAQAIVARVMTEEPRSISAQRRTVPPHVTTAAEVALSKLPADRFATAAEFAAALSGESALPAGRARSPVTAPRHTSRAIAVLGAGLALASALAAWGWLRRLPEPSVSRGYVKFPEAEAPVTGRTTFALLPDGSALIYVGKAPNGGTQLWIKKRSELHATPVGGTAGATNVFASPDGRWIGFIADRKLKKVPVAGGDATTLADAGCISVACTGGAESGAWLDDDRIAFVSTGLLVAIPSTGGKLDTLVRSSAVAGFAPILPSALPDSRGVLFTACTLYCNKADVHVLDLATGKVRLLVENAIFPRYSPTGHLIYSTARGAVFAIPFDLSTLTTRGTATAIIDRVAGSLAMSSSGTLAYIEGDNSPRAELVLVSRDGKSVQPVDTAWQENFATLALSPDGNRLAATVVGEGQEHIWIKTIGGTTPSRLTFGFSQNTAPTWTPDGATLLFTRFEPGPKSTFMSKRVDGTGAEVTLESGNDWVIESSMGRTSDWLAVREYRQSSGARDIYARRLHDNNTSDQAVVATPTEDLSPSLSPDAKWLVYSSDESGAREIWVVPFPDPKGAKWQVSTNGGFEPLWSRDGREIFYVAPDNDLVAVEVNTTAGFSTGKRQVLFGTEGYRRNFSHRGYDVTPDGRRFVMIHDVGRATGDLVMVDNWLAEAKRRLGGAR